MDIFNLFSDIPNPKPFPNTKISYTFLFIIGKVNAWLRKDQLTDNYFHSENIFNYIITYKIKLLYF